MSQKEIKTLTYQIASGINPYENIALEEYFLTHIKPRECMLYLWQNRKTVVIGYNQNAWKECCVETLEADGGFLARRLSGGGAVFHDLGNLNFTFLMRKDQYHVEKQTEVILKAVRSFGIHAVRSGRNDLTVGGAKFSGNAYYQTGDFCYHHGTLLLDADMGALSRYLQVSQAKLRSKGVESVKSRVINLKEYRADLTVGSMEQRLLASFEEVYEGKAQPFASERICREVLSAGKEKFSSWEWLYGRKIPFNQELERRFSWGEILIRLDVESGVIQKAQVWTDALDVDLAKGCKKALEQTRFLRREMVLALEQMVMDQPQQNPMIQDLIIWIGEEWEHGISI